MSHACPGTEELARWLTGDLSASQLGPLEAHIEVCLNCQAAVEKMLNSSANQRDDGAHPTILAAEAAFLQQVERQKPDTFALGTVISPPLPTQTAAPPPALKDYDILEEIGRGGMGIVYKAWQRRLNRPVAIKMVLLGAAAKPEILLRFRQEAELAARLLHPHIVQVHEISHQHQTSYLVMELVEGGSLSRQCDRRPQPALEAARLVDVLARAIEHAHRKGVLHRDLKPSNILLTADGVPKIADFGLATCIGFETGLTTTGSLLGTPEYMAPEQANQRQRQIGPATDVYGLGAILYEMLTGRPPITGTDLMDVLVRLREEEVIPPRRLQPSVPRDLETVCLKCLQKDPPHRYSSAEALADDLRRFLEGMPTLARPVSMPERAWRWAKRNRTLAATLGAIAVLLMVLTLGSTIASVLFREQRDRAVDAERRTEIAHRETQDLLARKLQSVAGEVRALRLRGERGAYYRGMPKLRATLVHARELGAPEEVIRAIRDEMGNLLTVGDIEIAREWDGYPPRTDSIVFAPNLDRYAKWSIDGLMTVHEAGTGKEISRLPFPTQPKSGVISFSLDGRLLLIAGWNRKVYCCGVDVPKGGLKWSHDGYPVFASPDGKAVLYSNDKMSFLVEAQSGKEIRRFAQGVLTWRQPIHPHRPWVILDNQKKLIAVDYRTGKEMGSVPDRGSVCWHPFAPVVAVSSFIADNRISLWDVTTGRLVVPPLLGHSNMGVDAVFDPTGKYLVSKEWSDIVRVWDASTGRLVFQTPLGFSGGIHFSPDGETVAAVVEGQKLGFFRVYPGEGLRIVTPANRGWAGFGDRLAIDPSGRVIAISVWKPGWQTLILDAENGRELASLPGRRGLVASFGGNALLLLAGEAGVERWPVQLERGVYRIGPPERLVLPRYNQDRWGISADGRVIAIPDYHRGAFVLDRRRGGGIQPTEAQHDVRHVDVSPDGRWIMAGSHMVGEASVYEARTGKRVQQLISDGGYGEFSPGGRWIGVFAAHSGSTLFRAGTWELVRPLGDGRCAFAPDDLLAAVGAGFGVIRLVGTETGQEVSRLETTDQTKLQPLAFSLDGGRLYALGEQTRSLYIWDLRRIRSRLKAMDADWDWPAFSPLPKRAEDGPPTVRIEMK